MHPLSKVPARTKRDSGLARDVGVLAQGWDFGWSGDAAAAHSGDHLILALLVLVAREGAEERLPVAGVLNRKRSA